MSFLIFLLHSAIISFNYRKTKKKPVVKGVESDLKKKKMFSGTNETQQVFSQARLTAHGEREVKTTCGKRAKDYSDYLSEREGKIGAFADDLCSTSFQSLNTVVVCVSDTICSSE